MLEQLTRNKLEVLINNNQKAFKRFEDEKEFNLIVVNNVKELFCVKTWAYFSFNYSHT